MTRIDADWLNAAPARTVTDCLVEAGYQALFVGGCVRDAILGRAANDIDVATDALPADVITLAEAAGIKAVPTGMDHGTITLVVQSSPIEVTTFRSDEDTDGRHATVKFSNNAADDARRRDFTMNALYATPEGEIVDPLKGLPDLRAGHVRFIGDAETRIREDYLRILRFFRFTAWYGDPALGIDADGLAACAAEIEGLEKLSAERVTHEITRLLSARDPAPAFAAMVSCGAAGRLLPGAQADAVTVLAHLEDLHEIAPDPRRRLVATGGDLSGLRLSKKDQKHIAKLRTLIETSTAPAALGFLGGREVAESVVLLRAAMTQTAPPENAFAQVAHGAVQVFPVRAADVMDRYQGKAIADRLAELQARWIASDFTATRDDLLA